MISNHNMLRCNLTVYKHDGYQNKNAMRGISRFYIICYFNYAIRRQILVHGFVFTFLGPKLLTHILLVRSYAALSHHHKSESKFKNWRTFKFVRYQI